MKNFFAAILLCLFIPNLALASVSVSDCHILFSYGFSELELSKKRIGEGSTDAIVLTGNNLSALEIHDDNTIIEEGGEILVIPKTDLKIDDYRLWQIKGTYENKDFYILGYTIVTEGDSWIERNPLPIDVIKLLLLVGLVIGIGVKMRKRKRKRST